MSDPALSEAVATDPRLRPKREQRRKRQPPYAVVLHNDDRNSFDFVIECLVKVFGYAAERSAHLTMTAHTSGQSHVWSGTRELAELKAEQLAACGADPAVSGAAPLTVSLEPLPGE